MLARDRHGTATIVRDGEAHRQPEFLRYVWLALVLLVVLEATNDIFRLARPLSAPEDVIDDIILVASVGLLLARAARERVGRGAWLAFATAQGLWSIGTIAWGVFYAGQPTPPTVSLCDVPWMLWYPVIAAGIALLIRVRVANFELHRWMDGVGAILVVLVAGFALILQPLADHTGESPLATVVTFAYPILDLLLIGAVLGVYGLLGWRPDRMWLALGMGILVMTIPDAVAGIQEARGMAKVVHPYSFLWSVGALLIAYAAWVRVPGGARDEEVTGLRAVALALTAQAIAAAIEIYGLFVPLGDSERILTLAVLVVASVQIYLSRPRRAPDTAEATATQVPPGEAVGRGAGEPRDGPAPVEPVTPTATEAATDQAR